MISPLPVASLSEKRARRNVRPYGGPIFGGAIDKAYCLAFNFFEREAGFRSRDFDEGFMMRAVTEIALSYERPPEVTKAGIEQVRCLFRRGWKFTA